MGHIYYLMGKSSSGKDTIFKMLKSELKDFHTIVLYTTRPIREGEKDGVEYYFIDDDTHEQLVKNHKIIESRSYNTVHGIWKYFTVNDNQMDLKRWNYLVIGTLESYEQMCEFFGKEKLVPLYIEVADGIRLKRAIEREENQEQPKYEELCRRFLADAKDFTEEKLNRLGINRRFSNTDVKTCINEILLFIRGIL